MGVYADTSNIQDGQRINAADVTVPIEALDAQVVINTADLATAETDITALDTLISQLRTGAAIMTAPDIDGGTIDGAVIGGSTPAAGDFTTIDTTGLATLASVSSASATITGGSVNNTPIGGSTPSTGAFTDVVVGSSNFNVDMDGTDETTLLKLTVYDDGTTTGPNITGRKAKGTSGTPANVTANTRLLKIIGEGWYDGAFYDQVEIRFHAVGTWSGSGRGSFISFLTTDQASTTKSERVYIHSDGELQVVNHVQIGTNLGMGTDTFGTSADGVIAIAEGTSPTTSPADMIQMYCTTGELRVRDEAGNVTTQSPHSKDAPFDRTGRLSTYVYHDYNVYEGNEVWLDVYGALEALESLTPQQFIYSRRVEPKYHENKFMARLHNRRAEVKQRMKRNA